MADDLPDPGNLESLARFILSAKPPITFTRSKEATGTNAKGEQIKP